jgi:hypothetical protein
MLHPNYYPSLRAHLPSKWSSYNLKTIDHPHKISERETAAGTDKDGGKEGELMERGKNKEKNVIN